VAELEPPRLSATVYVKESLPSKSLAGVYVRFGGVPVSVP
jgi:hypothetical protein